MSRILLYFKSVVGILRSQNFGLEIQVELSFLFYSKDFINLIKILHFLNKYPSMCSFMSVFLLIIIHKKFINKKVGHKLFRALLLA